MRSAGPIGALMFIATGAWDGFSFDCAGLPDHAALRTALVGAVAELDLLATAGATGVSGDPERPDSVVDDIVPNPDGGTGVSAGGFGHPECLYAGDRSVLPPIR